MDPGPTVNPSGDASFETTVTLSKEEAALQAACSTDSTLNAPMLVAWLMRHYDEEPTAINGEARIDGIAISAMRPLILMVCRAAISRKAFADCARMRDDATTRSPGCRVEDTEPLQQDSEYQSICSEGSRGCHRASSRLQFHPQQSD